MTWGRGVFAAAVLLAASASPARAQVYGRHDAPRFGSIEAGGGVAWTGGVFFGEKRAVELRNPGTGTDPLLLFTTSSRLEGAAGLQARFGFYLTPRIVLEAGARYSKPALVTRIANDFEEASDTVARETLGHYVFDGSIVLHLVRLGGGRFVPFVQGGAGHVRDLHQQGELVETGTEYHGGGGVKIWMGEGAPRFGLRADAAVSSRSGAFDLAGKRRTVPIAGASLIILF